MAGLPATSVAEDGGIRIVLCGTDGMRTFIFDPQTGSYTPADDEQAQAKCPYCVLGAVVLPDAQEPIAATLSVVFSDYDAVAPLWVIDTARQSANGIRAPPLVL